MTESIVLMLVIMNPFAQMVYLGGLMSDVQPNEFRQIFLRAAVFSLAICLVCAFLGEPLLFRVFGISLPAMRVFGGLINLSLAYSYVMKGPEGIKLFKGDITNMAQQIALPVLVGAGVVWVSIRVGRDHPPAEVAAVITTAVVINAGSILLYHLIFHASSARQETRLVKYLGMAMRFNALLIGAVSIEMILGGISEYWLSYQPIPVAPPVDLPAS